MVRRLERVLLVAGMALATVNVFTGAPLLGLWVGAQIVSTGQITMLAVFVVVVVMFAAASAMVMLLGWLGAKDDQLTGRTSTVRRHTPWLRSMRGERPHETPGVRAQLNELEYVLVAVVVLAFVALEYWFFFESGSPLGAYQSGRD